VPDKLWPWRRRAQKRTAAAPVGADPDRRRRRIRRVLLILGPALVALVGGYLYVTGGRFVETDDAYVKADMVSVSARVSGPIAEVDIRENQHVAKGQVLFRLDPQPFQIALAQAEARLAKAANDVKALKASYRQKQEELDLARTNVTYAERDFKRQADLAQHDFASGAKYDEAKHNLESARHRVAVLQQELSGILADLTEDPEIPVERHPSYLEAEAERDQAALDLEHTVVAAPFAGVASQKPEPGDYVTAGMPVMSIVADRNVWIEANFKETDLTHVRPGQPATVQVDTYPDRQWQAEVESISQATGAQFSVLPPQNATGNWVKVVQRIPVRIALRADDGDPPLRAGMSVTAEIDTGHQRELPGVVEGALAWAGWLAAPPTAEAGNQP
jgi:membrane fusion protein (multidrug efflux system)